MPQLTLYYSRTCSYTGRVLAYMRDNKITFPMKEIHSDPKIREELIRIGGKGQTPCLVIDGKALYESVDIIDWLKKNWKSQ